jgi:hypothetical protein
MVADSESSKRESLQQEFRTTITCLTLATALNNLGQSTLRSQEHAEGYQLILESEDEISPILLANAIAVLLVVDVEVLSLVPCKRSASEPDGPIVAFIVVANPDDKQRPRQQEDYVVSKKGVSNFGLISSENWNCLKIR